MAKVRLEAAGTAIEVEVAKGSDYIDSRQLAVALVKAIESFDAAKVEYGGNLKEAILEAFKET